MSTFTSRARRAILDSLSPRSEGPPLSPTVSSPAPASPALTLDSPPARSVRAAIASAVDAVAAPVFSPPPVAPVSGDAAAASARASSALDDLNAAIERLRHSSSADALRGVAVHGDLSSSSSPPPGAHGSFLLATELAAAVRSPTAGSSTASPPSGAAVALLARLHDRTAGLGEIQASLSASARRLDDAMVEWNTLGGSARSPRPRPPAPAVVAAPSSASALAAGSSLQHAPPLSPPPAIFERSSSSRPAAEAAAAAAADGYAAAAGVIKRALIDSPMSATALLPERSPVPKGRPLVRSPARSPVRSSPARAAAEASSSSRTPASAMPTAAAFATTPSEESAARTAEALFLAASHWRSSTWTQDAPLPPDVPPGVAENPYLNPRFSPQSGFALPPSAPRASGARAAADSTLVSHALRQVLGAESAAREAAYCAARAGDAYDSETAIATACEAAGLIPDASSLRALAPRVIELARTAAVTSTLDNFARTVCTLVSEKVVGVPTSTVTLQLAPKLLSAALDELSHYKRLAARGY